MIQLNDISLSFGSRGIFKNLEWNIKDGKRIGLFGPNGEGKTTLLNVISGLTGPDSGALIIPPDQVIGYLPQEVEDSASERTVVEEALTAFQDILVLERDMESVRAGLGRIGDKNSDEYKKALHRLDEIQNELNTREAHTIRFRTEKLLMGLGFEPGDLAKPINTFSGGWRMRVALAKLLLIKPDFLLLDEPTNHLDIESIDWLETYLEEFQGTVILVSHDKYFLDRMVDTIAELRAGRITEYSGNYSSYLVGRRSRYEIQKSAYENQQRKIRDTERFIERFRYKNTKAKQVQSRIKMLEKLERLDPPPSDQAAIHFKFPEPERSGKVVLELSRFSKSYPNGDGALLRVFENAGPLTVSRGDKIALIGKNGAGKSTLARILLRTEPFDGERKEGYNVEVTYFAQHQAESLAPANTVIEELESEAAGKNETQIRSLLGAFLFSEQEVYKKVAVLSGGEKSRVALAKTLLSPRNFMILDEPTNHLDIQSRNVLVDALRQYKGTFIVVSHDRHFLDKIANKIWYAERGSIITYPGTYSEFRYHQSQREKNGAETAPRAVPAPGNDSSGISEIASVDSSASEKKKLEAEKRNRLYRELKEHGIENMERWEQLSPKQLASALTELEERIHKIEEKKTEIEAFLADPDNFNDNVRSQKFTEEYSHLDDKLKKLYERWEAVSAYMENHRGD
ncbi:MAG: ABC-F family ATP-binding cassette domain-containing protein [Deltaproteobacteria bacterium]